MDNLTPEQVSEQLLKDQVEATLNNVSLKVPQSKQLIINDLIARNKQTRILEPVDTFIKREYASFLQPIEKSFTSKEEVYNHLISKGIQESTKPFYDEYLRLCKASGLWK